MAVPLPSLLTPSGINQTVSELKVRSNRLQNFFIGGGGTAQQSGRNFAWDVFNESREVEGGRAPGTGPSRIAPQIVGNVTGRFPRIHASLPLLYEQVHNLRKIGSLELDTSGEQYIIKQEQYLAQRLVNHRELQFAGMMRGAYYYVQDGDNIKASLSSSGASQTVDFRVPAGNKGQLDMLGAGAIIDLSWHNAASHIPTHLYQIDGAFQQLTGRRLENLWCSGKVWGSLQTNTDVKALAGTSNVAFTTLSRTGDNDFVAILTGIPWLKIHVCQDGLNFDGTFTKLFGDDEVLLCPEPDSEWVQLLEGSEIVIEYPGAAPTERFGSYFWAEPTTKPAGYELISLGNFIPALYNPSCIAFADVTP